MTEIEKKSSKRFEPANEKSAELIHSLQRVCEGLIYISEVDSPVTVFVGGSQDEGDIEYACREERGAAKEMDFGAFFERLTARKDWHGEREHTRTKKFLDLRKLIEENLTEPKVFKIGETHVKIVAAGLDADGRTVGVTMKALET